MDDVPIPLFPNLVSSKTTEQFLGEFTLEKTHCTKNQYMYKNINMGLDEIYNTSLDFTSLYERKTAGHCTVRQIKQSIGRATRSELFR
jgi:hypothetical protein